MAPLDRYDEITWCISSDVVRAEVDNFYKAKSNIKTTMKNLEAQGVTFSFIAGYGLPFGACTSDYSLFGFMKNAPTTNSDEIINIDSTAPGTSFVPYGQKFADTEGRELSPDGSLDISTALFKESSWYFYEQKHELEYNNTALSLALNLATGEIKTVADCDNPDEDKYYYPQFNGARNLKPLVRNYFSDLEKYCEETGYELTADQEEVLDKAKAMMANTVNDYEKDNAVIAEVRAMLVEIGVYEPDAEPETGEIILNKVLKGLNDIVYSLVGPKGYFD